VTTHHGGAPAQTRSRPVIEVKFVAHSVRICFRPTTLSWVPRRLYDGACSVSTSRALRHDVTNRRLHASKSRI